MSHPTWIQGGGLAGLLAPSSSSPSPFQLSAGLRRREDSQLRPQFKTSSWSLAALIQSGHLIDRAQASSPSPRPSHASAPAQTAKEVNTNAARLLPSLASQGSFGYKSHSFPRQRSDRYSPCVAICVDLHVW